MFRRGLSYLHDIIQIYSTDNKHKHHKSVWWQFAKWFAAEMFTEPCGVAIV